MASTGSPQERLDRVVRVIAQNMVAEVCSIYLVRAGGVLELFATEGLSSDAVHKTRLAKGEGLVGLVAERSLPLNLTEATTHPRFSYRPETGEELYHSFLGVPLVSANKVAGVLTVQNVADRTYAREEVEVLQTIAMVVAETVGAGVLVREDELREDAVELGQPITLDGVGLAYGVATGGAVLHKPRAIVRKTIAEDVDVELNLLQQALTRMQRQFEDLLAHPELSSAGAHREVLESYRLFAYDPSWQQRMEAQVKTGLTAEAAVQRVQQDTRARMAKIRDPYIRERMSDADELSDRLLRTLQGGTDSVRAEMVSPSILVARNLGAADLLEYQTENLQGVVLEEGSNTSHVTIVARAMGIPVLGRLDGLLQHVEAGDELILDVSSGKLYIRPTEDVVDAFTDTIAERRAELATYLAEKDLPSVTTDGAQVDVLLNAGLLVDMGQLERTGATGIGLFRTEFQFMVSATLPRVEEQSEVYAQVLDQAGEERPVVFRTLDIGGDKQVPFLPRHEEENPAMGWRAIRIGIDRPALLRYQLRALIRAAAGRALHVMFPMIAEVDELRRCKAILRKELDRARQINSQMPREVRIGCMIEVPSIVAQMDQLCPEVDFLSVGTNDLMQFYFACDRGNPQLSDRYDLLSPAALWLLRQIIDSAARHHVPVTVCGELAGRPLEAIAMIGLGLRRLSVSANAVGPIKRVIRQIDSHQLADFIAARDGTSQRSLRDDLFHFVRDRGVRI